MTGGVERYIDRGIIPRSISAIFAEVSRHSDYQSLFSSSGQAAPSPCLSPHQVSKRSDYQFSVHISYLEIYNETGYDLLDPDREVKALEDLPKVFLL